MLLAQQDSRPLIEFTLEPLTTDIGFPLAVMGILVVFMALVLVVVFITVLPHALAAISGKPKQEQATTVPVAAEDELSEETLVVIAAAVAQALDRPHRIVRIRGLTPADLGWSFEGLGCGIISPIGFNTEPTDECLRVLE